MTAFLEVWRPSGAELVPLGPDRLTIGRGPGNSVVLAHDRMVSTLHAVLEPLGGGWCVRDLGSRNGTLLGGEPVLGDRALRPGDELVLGRTRLVFRAIAPPEAQPTEGADPAPELTRRERDVLRALCRPLFADRVFSEPATQRQIAAELVVSEAAVKQHLVNLYGKFRIDDGAGNRRVQLANEAVRRRAVTLPDLR